MIVNDSDTVPLTFYKFTPESPDLVNSLSVRDRRGVDDNV